MMHDDDSGCVVAGCDRPLLNGKGQFCKEHNDEFASIALRSGRFSKILKEYIELGKMVFDDPMVSIGNPIHKAKTARKYIEILDLLKEESLKI